MIFQWLEINIDLFCVMQIWYVDWFDLGDASVDQRLLPRIGAYTAEQLKEHIRIVSDSTRTLKVRLLVICFSD